MDWNVEHADWEDLLWAATYPSASQPLRDTALTELERRLGSRESVLEVVRERLAFGLPIGAVPDWMPKRCRSAEESRLPLGDDQ